MLLLVEILFINNVLWSVTKWFLFKNNPSYFFCNRVLNVLYYLQQNICMYRNQCLCVNYKNTQNEPKEVDESRCDVTCNGDPLQKCGSEFVVSVYQTITSSK